MSLTINQNSKPDVAWISKTTEKLFGGGQWDLPPIPFSSKLISELLGEIGKKVYAFHIQSVNDLPSTINIQNSTKTISASRNKIMNPEKWKGPGNRPHLPGENIVVKIEGTLVFGNSADIFSRPDEKGMRWVGIGDLRFHIDSSKSPNGSLFEPIIESIESWQTKNKKRLEPIWEEYEKKSNKRIKTPIPVDPFLQKEKYELIKEFFDVVNKSFKDNKVEIVKEYQRLLANKEVSVQKALKDYDEYLISNFKITSIYVPKKSEYVDKEALKSYKIDIEDNENTFYRLT
jgi:ribosomal protein L7/L12